MKKRVTIYLKPIEKEIELNDNLDEDERYQELSDIIFDRLTDELKDKVEIDYWEEEK